MKRFMAFIICICFVLGLLTACSVQTPDTSQMTSLQTEVSELRAENKQLKATLDQQKVVQIATIEVKQSPTVENTPIINSEPAVIPEKNIRELNLGETITIVDNCEFTLENVEFSKKIIPPNPGTYYSYYEAKEPQTTFLHVVVRYKNLGGTNKMADEFGLIVAIYNEKYEYPLYSIVEKENRSDFTYSNITSINPLSTGYVHYLADVPEEVESSGLPVLFKLTVNGEVFQYHVQKKINMDGD